MTSCWKKFMFIIAGSLVIVFLAGPPMAFAYKFPKAFLAQEKNASKKGFCAPKYIFNKDKLDGNEAILENEAETEINQITFFNPVRFMNGLPFESIPLSPPLRC